MHSQTCATEPACIISRYIVYFAGVETVWNPLRRDVGEDENGRGRRVLHVSARDPKGQGESWQAQVAEDRHTRPQPVQIPVRHPLIQPDCKAKSTSFASDGENQCSLFS